jgi:hypothetical protein
MSYASILQDLPQELQLPMLRLVEAVQKDLRDQLAVRREDFDELRATVHELAEAQKRTQQQIEELVEAQRRTETEIRTLVAKQTDMDMRLDKLVGDQLERRYRERAYAYFYRILRGVQVVTWQEVEENLERHLSDGELEELFLLDVLVRGQAGRQPDAPEVWLALEVSTVVDRNDVQRAQRRAALLRKAGYRVIPTVAGKEVTLGGEHAARDGHVLLLQDGRRQFWEEALAAALSS